jgi:AcrR family transcriptional regulator
LPSSSSTLFEPRKSPLQARSTASVEAILHATIQVLLRVGKERLTTTRVAYRAGVSVGTLYQYFPNKKALLQAVLKRHLDGVAANVEQTCREQIGNSLDQMGTALVTSFLQAKMKDVKTSVALYSVSSDVDGAKIVHEIGIKINKAMREMFATSREPLKKDPQLVASILQDTMAGVSRRMLESATPEREAETLHRELIFFVRAYLAACSVEE